MGADDAIIYLLHHVYSHLEKPGWTLRITFFDFSSTFSAQGTVLSPLLFILYTSDLKYITEGCHLQKFSDDSAIVGCVRNWDEAEHRRVVGSFVNCRELNQLQRNISKTKEMVVDLRRTWSPVTPMTIKGPDLKIVQDYKYLGVYMDSKLDRTKNSMGTHLQEGPK